MPGSAVNEQMGGMRLYYGENFLLIVLFSIVILEWVAPGSFPIKLRRVSLSDGEKK
jgi:hypothetical protein